MSNGTGATDDFTYVRVCVSSISFSILLLFNLVINWTIVRGERLRCQARFVFVFHLLVSALVHFGTSSVFHLQIYLGWRPAAAVCVATVTILITSASNILITLTVMALDRYLAVCHPLRYSSMPRGGQCAWLVGLVTWIIALLIPLSLLHPQTATGPNGECGPEQLKKGKLQRILLISVCSALILYSYVRILAEGRRLGVLNRRNRVGCRTIALHGSQLAVYILPNFVSFVLKILEDRAHLQPGTKELSAVVNFAFFSLAQCVAPIVYGLRKEELLEQVHRRFPLCSRRLKSLLGWTVRAVQTPSMDPSPRSRERTMTVQTTLSLEFPQTPLGERDRPLLHTPDSQRDSPLLQTPVGQTDSPLLHTLFGQTDSPLLQTSIGEKDSPLLQNLVGQRDSPLLHTPFGQTDSPLLQTSVGQTDSPLLRTLVGQTDSPLLHPLVSHDSSDEVTQRTTTLD